MKRHVALVGFMASGKSTVGRRLAARLDWNFIDTDRRIEEERGSIASIFDREGEAAFRRYERAAVAEALASRQPAVIAVGGGAVTYAPTRSLLRSRAVRVWLDVPEESIRRRIARGPHRPPLARRPTAASVRALFLTRLPLYRDSEIRIDCSGARAAGIARRIEASLRKARYIR